MSESVYGVTVDELADFLRIEDEREHVHLSDAMGAAKIDIDTFCGQSFDAVAAASARVFSARWPDLLYINPCTSVTGLAVDTSGDGTFNQAWASTDYQLEPLNRIKAGMTDHSYVTVRAIEARCFPVTKRAAVEVTATWGWDTVPAGVKQALKMHAAKLHQRRNMPAALVATEDGGVTRAVMGLDSDVRNSLKNFRRVDLWT